MHAVAPNPPQLNADRPKEIIENKVCTYTCTVDGGRPAAHIQWVVASDERARRVVRVLTPRAVTDVSTNVTSGTS